ncbi:DUF4129 domain-containing protein [Natrialbaceae archaeon A-arb3/5]
MSDDTPSDESTAGPDYRQVSFVALAAIALVLAALFAPALAGQASDDEGEGDGIDLEFDWSDLLDWFDFDWGDGEPESPACTVWLSGDPIPGSEVTASVTYHDEPLSDASVWFNDHHVGETDDQGRVTGEVPYDEELVVQIDADDHDCRAVGPTAQSSVSVSADNETRNESGYGDATGADRYQGARASADLTAISIATTTVAADRTAAGVQDGATGNASVEYEVDGAVSLGVHGAPYPGDEITVEATIEGVPMREANVAVNGESIGETDDEGTIDLRVPDDGSDEFALTVARGDFDRTATVDVRLLEATFSTDSLAPIPGSDGYAVAEIAGEPVEDAAVSVDGEAVGTTDSNGAVPIELPRDPTATVTVSTDDQTASTTLVGAYAVHLVVFGVLAVGATAVGYRTRGARGTLAVLCGLAGLLAALVAEAFYGPIGGVAVLAVLALVVIGLTATRSDRNFDTDPSSIRRGFGRYFEWVIGRVLAIVALLESLLDRLRSIGQRAWTWATSLPRSAAALALELLTWLGSLPRRGVAGLRRALSAAAKPSRWTVAGVVGAAALVGATYVVFGSRDAAIVAGACLLVGVGLFAYHVWTDDDETAATEDADSEAVDHVSPISADEAEPPSFREIWRAFARTVAPQRWRTRTPGEIERRAIEQGLPPEPVTELTTLFREVEFGGRPRTRAVRERANDAYATLSNTRADGDGERGRDEPWAATARTDRHDEQSRIETGRGSNHEEDDT